MKKILLFIMSLFPFLSMGQTTLSAGDIVIIAINGDTDATYGRGFSFMPLVNLEAGTEIYFTDYGWSDVAGSFITSTAVSDVFVKYTVPAGGISAGTIIRNASNSTTNFTFYYAYGSSTFDYVNLVGVSASDEVLAFQGSIASPTFIFAVSYVSTTNVASGWATSVPTSGVSSGTGSALPGSGNASVIDLVDDVTALSFNQVASANDNCAYTGPTTATDKAGWQARISNYSNWTFNDATPIPTPPTGSYSVTGTSTAPTVTTQAVSSIAVTTATGNGNITSLGSPNPTEHGVCWNTGGTPTTSNSKTTQGAASATGAFTSSFTGLSANTTYYVRAYATNTAGTSYGSEVTFTTLTNGTFTGASSNDWNTAGNWAGGSVPTSGTDVTIPSGKTPVIGATTPADCNDLNVSGTLTIQSSSSGTGSLKINGTSTGNVSCERYMTGSAWHVVSPIAEGGSISTFIQAAGNSIPTSGSNYGMMDYNETGNSWNSYFTTATAGNLTAGKGYNIRRSANGVVTFTGTLTSGTKTVNITKAGSEGWNCIGNPYTSAINMNTAAGASNFLATNSSNLDGSYACIYVWDDASSSYKILGNVSYGARDLGQNILQSGQGFFVKALNNSGLSVQFTSAMQVHSTGTALKSGQVSWPGFELTVASSDVKASTVVAFNNDMTNGLDPTYDAGLLRGTSGVSLYTRLVDDNGVDFAIQCLPETDSKNLVIPVGLDCSKGGEVRFAASASGLPEGCSIILEDRANKTFTLLESGKELVTTVAANTSGTGRFYIHTSALTTGTSGVLPDGVFSLKAYPAGGQIRITGNVSSAAKAYLYHINGSALGQFNLSEGNSNSISAEGLATGVYLLKVTDGSKQFNTKIVLY